MALAQALIANRGPIEDLVGFELVARAARLVLIDGVNAQIDTLQERWMAADEVFEAAGHDVGIAVEGIEHISTENVFQGPHKSLLASPISRFPNLTVSAYASRPGTGNPQNDVHRTLEISLLVELMIAAGPVDARGQLFFETLAHRRVERTTEAVLKTIGASQNLLGTVNPIGEPRGGIVNSSWTKKSEGGREEIHVLHGARFQYALTRYAARYQAR